jgi:hypothetical protein
MGRKFIKTINEQNFVYPNNTIQTYGSEIVHDINNNSVSGTVTTYSATTVSETGITFTYDVTWNKNGAEVFYDNGFTTINVVSFHVMTPDVPYWKPWRAVENLTAPTTGTTSNQSGTFTITPNQFGLSSFTNGDYTTEIRFIGKRSVYPVCVSTTVSGIVVPTPTPTPTPTVTPTSATPTPTPTPSSTPVYITYKSGATLNVTDPGWIKYDTNTQSDVYAFVSNTGTYTITACTNCNSIIPGFPFADVASFTVTNCGSDCTPSTSPTPTPSVTSSPQAPIYYRLTSCTNFQTYYSQQYPSGTFNSGDRVEGSVGSFYVISGTYTSVPSGTSGQVYVYATGLYGCP